MNKLITFWHAGEHHFLLSAGKTFIGTNAGVWASYIPPRAGEKGTVMMLYATKEYRHYVPHVLGALGLHALRTYGELPEGSHNLSCHSLGIQQRLAKLLGQLPATAVVNNENWFSSISYNQMLSEVAEISSIEDITSDISAGKQFVLEIIRSAA